MVTERLYTDSLHDHPKKVWDKDHMYIHHENLQTEDSDNEDSKKNSLKQAFLYEDDLEFGIIQDDEIYTSHIDLGNVLIVKITTSSTEE